jgi:serine/threonine-protein kinase
MINKTLAHYKIFSKLGAGGMGEVYRAEDTKLGRPVAIKVLPDEFAGVPERLARFEREAKILASLNHQNIAQIYGLEEIEGQQLLVMEFAPGEDLAGLIGRGPIPVDKVIKISLQIAKGLEAAHEKGIIHRDLKPSNIKITPEGSVKILDFGIAKALKEDPQISDSSRSQTLTHGATEEGVILGTAAYMSPEQARGKPVDKRTDIWSFGCLLFEMLVGCPPFRGENSSDLISSILRDEPDWGLIPDKVSPIVTKLLKRCFNKEPTNRLRDIGDFRLEISEPFIKERSSDHKSEKQQNRKGRAILIGALALALMGWTVAFFKWVASEDSKSISQVNRFPIELTEEQKVDTTDDYQPISISKDGRYICWLGYAGGEKTIYVRSLGSLEIRQLPDTERAKEPVFSPDGLQIAFIRDNAVWKTSFQGGEVNKLYETESSGVLRSLSWYDHGSLAFNKADSDLFQILSSGGVPEVITAINPEKQEVALHHPHLLPDKKHMLLSVAIGNHNDCHIELLSLDTGKRELLIDQAYAAVYVSPGYLLFGWEGKLWAISFDLKKLQTRGPKFPVLSNVQMDDYGRFAHYAVAQNGTLVYAPGKQSERRLSWINFQGEMEHLKAPVQLYSDPRFSPDGAKLAVMIGSHHTRRIELYDIGREQFGPFTSAGSVNRHPTWSPDSSELAFLSNQDGQYDIFIKSISTDTPPRRLMTESEITRVPFSWSRDGKRIAFTTFPQADRNIWFTDVEGNSEPTSILDSEFNESQPAFSPDGRWLAYVSDEDGTYNVWVRRIDGIEFKEKVSRNGGTAPIWAPQGNKIYYSSLDGTKIFYVGVRDGNRPFGEEVLLLDGLQLPTPADIGSVWSFDIAPDGSRLVIVSETEDTQDDRLVIVTNWFEELKQKDPTKK